MSTTRNTCTLDEALAEWRGLPKELRDDLLDTLAAPGRLLGTAQFAVKLLRAAAEPEAKAHLGTCNVVMDVDDRCNCGAE